MFIFSFSSHFSFKHIFTLYQLPNSCFIFISLSIRFVFLPSSAYAKPQLNFKAGLALIWLSPAHTSQPASLILHCSDFHSW